MKKINLFMALMVAVLSFVACNNKEEKPAPVPVPEGLTFTVEIGEVTASSITYTVLPSDVEAEYLCILYDVETADEFTKDEYLVETLYQELTEEARTMGMRLSEYIPQIVDKGVIEDGVFSNLAPESDYYIILFGVDAANGYIANTEVFKTKVTTAEIPTIDINFNIDTVVDGNSAKYTVTPSDDNVAWYFYTIPARTFAAYTDPEGDYRMSEQSFLLYCLQMDIDALRKAGYSDSRILNTLFHKGTLTLQANGLIANTEYMNLVAGFTITPEGQVTIASELTKTTYTTGDVKPVELTFDISVTDIEPMRAAIKITPSDNENSYCWMCAAWDGEATAEDIMNSIVAQNGGWMNNGAMLYKGVQNYTGVGNSPYKFPLEAPDTNYFVIAFGYAGGITTKPTMVTFKSTPAPAAEDTTFTLTASNISPYGCNVKLVASESTTYYYVEICPTSAYDEEAFVQAVNDSFDALYEYGQSYNPNITPAEVLKSNFYCGSQDIVVTGLNPETELMGFIYALSTTTGHVVKTHVFENLATTIALGSVTPTVEIFGHYSGNEEAGSLFDNAAATYGKAITVVKYGNLQGARSLFAAMLGDDLTNVNNYPDGMLWAGAAEYWDVCKVAAPYSFYVADWDLPQTALAYVVDQTGAPGNIGRCYSCATVENKGDIQELKDLVTELNSGKSFTMPETVVFDTNGITVEVVSSEAVELPVAEAKAEVAAAVETVYVVSPASYIRPFYL